MTNLQGINPPSNSQFAIFRFVIHLDERVISTKKKQDSYHSSIFCKIQKLIGRLFVLFRFYSFPLFSAGGNPEEKSEFLTAQKSPRRSAPGTAAPRHLPLFLFRRQ